MRIHTIQTGTVTVRLAQMRGRGRGAARRLSTMTDSRWSEPLPIYAFAIEHPEGVIVVDTGETARASAPGYFPAWHPYYRRALSVTVESEEEIGPQLARLGIGAGDVRKVVLTHLHTDHAGGLHHFPRSQILASQRELDDARGLAGRLRGYLNNRYPSWLDPTALEFSGPAVGPFPHSAPITAAGDVLALPTGGHTPGHIAVLIERPDGRVLVAGDCSYTQQLLLDGAIDGVAPDEEQLRLTQRRIRGLAALAPLVYLVAHEFDSARRLERREPLPHP